LKDGAKAFVFMENCRSGGIGADLPLIENSSQLYCTTTCTDDGSGWQPFYDNGDNTELPLIFCSFFWTYFFLVLSEQQQYGGDTGYSLETIFDYAHEDYDSGDPPYYPDDEPQEFDGNPSYSFYI
jgi:hypothetical protein